MTGEKLDITVPVDSCTVIPEGFDQPAHHWVITPSGKATSLGMCRNCGKEREFRNSGIERGWATSNKTKP